MIYIKHTAFFLLARSMSINLLLGVLSKEYDFFLLTILEDRTQKKCTCTTLGLIYVSKDMLLGIHVDLDVIYMSNSIDIIHFAYFLEKRILCSSYQQ